MSRDHSIECEKCGQWRGGLNDLECACDGTQTITQSECLGARKYRCKHSVYAMRWHDTDEMRTAFACWFDIHDCMFETKGSTVILPDDCGTVEDGEWVLWMDGDFVVMTDEEFQMAYEVVS